MKYSIGSYLVGAGMVGILSVGTAHPADLLETTQGVDFKRANTPACHAATNYINAVAAQDPAKLASLFAPKMDFAGPDGKNRTEPGEVKDMYTKLFAARRATNPARENDMRPRFRFTSLAPSGLGSCFLEFDSLNYVTGRYDFNTVDHFWVDDEGKIVKFRPYAGMGWARELISLIDAMNKSP
jgi:hypothetical protein